MIKKILIILFIFPGIIFSDEIAISISQRNLPNGETLYYLDSGNYFYSLYGLDGIVRFSENEDFDDPPDTIKVKNILKSEISLYGIEQAVANLTLKKKTYEVISPSKDFDIKEKEEIKPSEDGKISP